jgi:aerobic carbon-monoxide dehydrogenase medium subunit
MKAANFIYRQPSGIDEVLSLLAENEGRAQILAGGQSLVPALNMRLAAPEMLIDVNRIDGLRGIEDRGDEIRFGAIVRHVEVMTSQIVAQRLPLLAAAMPYVGHMAVRNRGTIGGSVAFADPSAEVPAVAVALDATIKLRKLEAERTIAARDFFDGLYQTARRDDELITEILFPASPANEVFGFSEISRRHGDFASVGVIVRARTNARGLSVGEIVIFGSEAAPLLIPLSLGFELTTDATEAELDDLTTDVVDRMDPISNHQGRADTKRKQASVLLKRELKNMLQRVAHD